MSDKRNQQIIKEIEAIAAGHKPSDVTGGRVDLDGKKIPKPKKQKAHKSVESANRYYGEPAGFWMRVVAYILDQVFYNIILYGVIAVTGLGMVSDEAMLMAMQQAQQQGGEGAAINPELFSTIIGASTSVMVFSLALSILYYVGTVGSPMQATPAKFILGMRITTDNGARIGYLRAFVRILAYIVSAVIMMIGFIMVAFTQDKRGLHDFIAGTRVVYR